MMAPAWTTQPSPSCAPGSTIAAGWIECVIGRNLKSGRGRCENDLAGARAALLLRRPGLGCAGFAGRLDAFREEVELGVLQQVVDLEHPDNLQRVTLAIVAVGVDLVHKVKEHRPERDDRVDAALLQEGDALRPERLGRRKRGEDEDLRDGASDPLALAGEEPCRLPEDVLLEEPEYLRRALQHGRREHVGVPGLDRHDALVDELELRREQEEVRLPAALAPRGVVDQEVDLLVARLVARLHLVLADLPDEEPVLLEELPDDAFVDCGHASSLNRTRAGTHEFSPGLRRPRPRARPTRRRPRGRPPGRRPPPGT